MGRCQHCLSDHLRSIHFRPADFALILVGVRRYRCTYCNEVQSRWLLPWPLRWVLGLILLVALYLASAGPAARLKNSTFIADEADENVLNRIYAPVTRLTENPRARTWPVVREYVGYVDWWKESGLSHETGRPTTPPDDGSSEE